MEAYLLSIKEKKKPATLASYRRDLQRLTEYFSPRSLKDITEWELREYFSRLAADLSFNSFSRALSVARRYFLFLEEKGEISFSPLKGLSVTDFQKKSRPLLDDEKLEMLLNAPSHGLRGKRDAAMITLLCETGMKVSELVGMNRSDLCLASSTVVCGEGEKRREIPVSSKVLSALETCLTLSTVQYPKEKALFLGNGGKRLTRQGFWKILKDRALLLGIYPCTPQTLRLSLAKALLNRGESREQVRRLLGNRSDALLREYEKQKKGNQ